MRGVTASPDVCTQHSNLILPRVSGTPLGDPIEVGAAFAVLGRGTTSLRLTAAKSRMGHTEPASGAVGVCHAASLLAHKATDAVLHLRQMNPMITSLLQAHAAARLPAPFVPRQAAAGAVGSPAEGSWEAGTGVSAFAFQGTNAHAVLLSASGCLAARCAISSLWQRRRLWYTVPPHALLSQLAASRPVVQLQAKLGTATLTYLWDHIVAGRSLLPGAAMLEAALAAARLLLESSSPAAAPTLALCGSIIPEPLVLPTGAPGAMLVTSVAGHSVQVASSNGSRTQTHLRGNCARVETGRSMQLVAAMPEVRNTLAVIMFSADDMQPKQLEVSACLQQRALQQGAQYHLHPAIADSATQVGKGVAQVSPGIPSAGTRVPTTPPIMFACRQERL